MGEGRYQGGGGVINFLVRSLMDWWLTVGLTTSLLIFGFGW